MLVIKSQKVSPIHTTSDVEEEGSRNVKSILSAFCQTTTAHGLGHVVESKRPSWRWFWICAFVCALVTNIWHISILTETFLSYPSTQLTTMKSEGLKFPHITICNLQSISPSNMVEILANVTSKTKIYQDNIEDIDKVYQEFDIPMEKGRFTSPFAYYENIGEEVYKVGHQKVDFIASCIYGGQPCEEGDFKLFSDPAFFNCFTFTGSESHDVGNKRSTTNAGPMNGLTLVLFLESFLKDSVPPVYDEHSVLSNAVGARVVLHPHGTMPRPSNEGYDIMPGHSTSIGFIPKSSVRLHEPYGHCHQGGQIKIAGMNYSYTTEACETECAWKYVKDQCECHSTYYVGISESGYPFCGIWNKSDPVGSGVRVQCEHEQIIQIEASRHIKDSCHCYEQCTEFNYGVTLSESLWPAARLLPGFIVHVSEAAESQSKIHEFLDEIYSKSVDAKVKVNNFARINLYFKDLKVRQDKQTPSYYISKLFSDIGGTLGLWVGISLLTLTEVVVLVSNIIAMVVRYKNNNVHPNAKPSGLKVHD